MSYLATIKKRLPYPVRRLYRLGRGFLGNTRYLPGYWTETLAARLVTPGVQRWIPGLSSRLKILSATRISLVTTCGNRLEFLKASLPTFLAQRRTNYEVIVSIYADQQGCADYVRQRFGDHLRSGRLKLMETSALVFNKARAVNIAVKHCDADYLFLVDCDCPLQGAHVVEEASRQFNFRPHQIASFSFTGLLLVRRDHFMEIGGYDVDLRDLWAPDDGDFIARYVVHFHKSYVYLNSAYTFIISPVGDDWRIVEKGARHETWIDHERGRDPSQTTEALAETKYFQRIGGPKANRNAVFEATIRYFEQHPARLEFVAEPPVS